MDLPPKMQKRLWRRVTIDFVLGFIPVLGTLADVFYKVRRSAVDYRRSNLACQIACHVTADPQTSHQYHHPQHCRISFACMQANRRNVDDVLVHFGRVPLKKRQPGRY